MVDTKDSKSFVSDGVRVQVSSPVSKVVLTDNLFLFKPHLQILFYKKLLPEYAPF